MTFERPATESEWRPPNPPELIAGEGIGIDFEYKPGSNPTIDRPVGVGVYSHERRQGWYLPWAHEGGGNLPREIVTRWLMKELANRDVYGLATKMEMHQLHNLGIDPWDIKVRPHDVAFNAALLNENRFEGFSLEALCQEYLTPEERKIHPTTIEEKYFYRAHAGEVAERCIADARQAMLIHVATQPKIVQEKLTRVLAVEDRCILATVEMERNGARLNRGLLERWSFQLNEKITALYLGLHAKWKMKVNPNSGKSMAWFFNEIGVAKPTVFDEGTKEYVESWDADAIEALCVKKEKDGTKAVIHEDIHQVFLLKHYLSLKSKYVDKYLAAMDGNNHIHFVLHQLRSSNEGEDKGTTTGRFSCGGNPPGAEVKYNINIQQVMKVESQLEDFGDEFVIREAYIPDDGRVAGASDASQIEFRLFGHLARAEGITAAYAADPYIDFHMMVTKMMKPHITDPKQLKFERVHMKHNNFGCIYGMGRPKLARKLGYPCTCKIQWYERDDDGKRLRYFYRNKDHQAGCTAPIANDIMNEYEDKFPEAKQQLKRCSQLAEKMGFVTTYLGRRRRFPDGQKLHKALNARVQGTAADYFKQKMIELYERRHELNIKLRMPVHDEFVYDVDPGYAAALKVQNCLDEQSFTLTVPLLWETGTGSSWRHANEDKTFMKRFKEEAKSCAS